MVGVREYDGLAGPPAEAAAKSAADAAEAARRAKHARDIAGPLRERAEKAKAKAAHKDVVAKANETLPAAADTAAKEAAEAAADAAAAREAAAALLKELPKDEELAALVEELAKAAQIAAESAADARRAADAKLAKRDKTAVEADADAKAAAKFANASKDAAEGAADGAADAPTVEAAARQAELAKHQVRHVAEPARTFDAQRSMPECSMPERSMPERSIPTVLSVRPPRLTPHALIRCSVRARAPSLAQAADAAGAHANVCAILDVVMGKPPSLENSVGLAPKGLLDTVEPSELDDGYIIRFLRRGRGGSPRSTPVPAGGAAFLAWGQPVCKMCHVLGRQPVLKVCGLSFGQPRHVDVERHS